MFIISFGKSISVVVKFKQQSKVRTCCSLSQTCIQFWQARFYQSKAKHARTARWNLRNTFSKEGPQLVRMPALWNRRKPSSHIPRWRAVVSAGAIHFYGMSLERRVYARWTNRSHHVQRYSRGSWGWQTVLPLQELCKYDHKNDGGWVSCHRCVFDLNFRPPQNLLSSCRFL